MEAVLATYLAISFLKKGKNRAPLVLSKASSPSLGPVCIKYHVLSNRSGLYVLWTPLEQFLMPKVTL